MRTKAFLRSLLLIVPLALAAALAPGCSIKKWALNKVAGALSAEGGTVFTGDSDPQLVADALPFALKMYESLLEAVPENQDLLVATGKAFCMYSYAFVHSGADTMSDARIAERTAQYKRAKKLYLRGRDYLFRAWDLRHPGFVALVEEDKTDSALSRADAADTTLVYWTAASWMGAFSADKFDMSLAVDMQKPVAFMQRLLGLNESYGEGAAHEFFISYYGSIPASMGGSEKMAREHFARALELSKGSKAAPYVSLATAVCIGKQDVQEFRQLLGAALAIDVDGAPANRLANILSQTKAQWLLDHTDNFFLLDSGEGQEGIEGEEGE